MWRSCLFGGMGDNAQPLSTRALDCASQLIFWCSGMYAPGGTFSRARWDALTAINERAPGVDKQTGVVSRDADLGLADRVLPLRIYVPANEDGELPIMLFLHGGGFCVGSRALSQMHELCIKFAALRIVVVAVSYRLAPEHRFPCAVQDCYEVMRWIHDASRSSAVLPRCVDRTRFVLCGDSAGGNLACVMASLARDGITADLQSGAPSIPVAHLVLIYPVFFISPDAMGIDVRAAMQEKVAFISAPVRNWFGDSYVLGGPSALAALRTTDRRLAPLVAGLANFPPTTIVSAGLDLLRHENRFAAQQLSSAGVACVHRHYDKVPHGFATFHFLPQARACFDDIASDLAPVLAGRRKDVALGSTAATPYGPGVVTALRPDAVTVALEWGLPQGASAVAVVAPRVSVGALGCGVVERYRAEDDVFEIDLGWGKVYATGASVTLV